MSLRPGLLEPDTDSETRLIGQICGKYLIFKIKILWISQMKYKCKFLSSVFYGHSVLNSEFKTNLR